MPVILCAISLAASIYGVPEWLLTEVAYVESRFNPTAINVNKNGSIDRGLYQINDVAHPDAPAWCIQGSALYAAKYLKKLYNLTGSWYNALVCYNAGYGRWQRGAPERAKRYARMILSANPMYL